MRRVPNKLLPHKNTSYRLPDGYSSSDIHYAAPVYPERAQVVQKTKLVRTGTGELAVSSGQVFYDEEHVIVENALITVHRGTPWQRESKVIAVDHYDHPSVQGIVIAYLE